MENGKKQNSILASGNIPLFIKNNIKKVSLIVLGILVIVAGSFAWNNANSHSSKSAYKYKTLADFKISGVKAGQGISFKRPQEVTYLSAPVEGLTQFNLAHTITQDKDSITLAGIMTGTIYAGLVLPDAYVKNIGNNFSDSSSAGHDSSVKPLKDFVTQRTKNYKVSFTEPKSFSNNSIKANSWQMSFTGTASDSKTASIHPDITGVAILAIGKSSFYYFMVDSITKNWQPNQTVWNQVTDSIKIDQ